MAIIRAELQGKGTELHRQDESGKTVSVVCGVYDGIAEQTSDLTAEQTAACLAGSLMYCLEDHGLYLKTGSGLWEAVQE